MKKIGLFLILAVFLLTPILAQQESLGVFEKDSEIMLKQTCSNCTFVEVISVEFPNGTYALRGNYNMDKDGATYNYSFNNSSPLGEYIYCTTGDVDGTNTTVCIDFEVTLNGNDKPGAGIIVVFSLIFIAIFGFGLIYFLKSLVHVIQLDMDLIDCAIMISTYLSMWMFYYFSFEYLGNAMVNDILELAISIGSVTHVILPLVGFAVSFIMTNLKAKKKARVTY